MDTTATKDLERLEKEYRRKVAEIRSSPGLSWEKKERTVRELGVRYDQDRNELERSAA
jgi:hypothetical protein